MLAPLFFAAALNLVSAIDGSDSAKVAARPVDQQLELELNPAARTWSGSLLAKLELHGTSRRIELRLSGPVVSRVEMTDGAGRVDLDWGVVRDSVLAIEARRDLVPGRASLNVAFDGAWRDAARGGPSDTTRAVVRDVALLRARMRAGAGAVFPAWPAGTAPTRWTLMVHAPAGYDVRASARRTGTDETGVWRTWTFRTSGPVDADSLRVTVLPAGAKR